MCGILGVVAKNPVNQLLYDGLLVLQHRGQDAAGIVTAVTGGGGKPDLFRTISGGTSTATIAGDICDGSGNPLTPLSWSFTSAWSHFRGAIGPIC